MVRTPRTLSFAIFCRNLKSALVKQNKYVNILGAKNTATNDLPTFIKGKIYIRKGNTFGLYIISLKKFNLSFFFFLQSGEVERIKKYYIPMKYLFHYSQMILFFPSFILHILRMYKLSSYLLEECKSMYSSVSC